MFSNNDIGVSFDIYSSASILSSKKAQQPQMMRLRVKKAHSKHYNDHGIFRRMMIIDNVPFILGISWTRKGKHYGILKRLIEKKWERKKQRKKYAI